MDITLLKLKLLCMLKPPEHESMPSHKIFVWYFKFVMCAATWTFTIKFNVVWIWAIHYHIFMTSLFDITHPHAYIHTYIHHKHKQTIVSFWFDIHLFCTQWVYVGFVLYTWLWSHKHTHARPPADSKQRWKPQTKLKSKHKPNTRNTQSYNT